METPVVVAIVLAVLILLVLGILWILNKRRQKRRLHESLGPEYEETVARAGSEKGADKELEARRKRVQQLHIKELSSKQKKRFTEDWRVTQAEFVERPNDAIVEADYLVMKLMEARGYPVVDFEQRAADVSVNHPSVVRDYRAAHSIVEKHKREGASTEDLRQAMMHYRALVDELVGTSTSPRTNGRRKVK